MAAGAESQAQLWCEDVASLTNIGMDKHVMERPEDSGHAAPEQVARVPVGFDPSWRPFHDDGSMGEGVITWGYGLVRESADTPWPIFDQGVG